MTTDIYRDFATAIREAASLDRAGMLDFHRDVFAARLRHELQRETHVVVGDHPPEPRLKPPTRGPDGTFHNPTDDPDICDADGLPVAQCGGAACRSHKRCCWQ